MNGLVALGDAVRPTYHSANVYPGVILERDGDQALEYVLDEYKKLVAFYERAAERGQAVIFAIS